MKNRSWIELSGLVVIASGVSFGRALAAGNGSNPGLSDHPSAVDSTQPSTANDQGTPDTTYGPSATMGSQTNVSSLSDRELAHKVRSSIRDDSTLSPSAHNVKVSASNGRVRLRGKVPSQSDKDMIGSKAAEIVGSGNVDNELNVK